MGISGTLLGKHNVRWKTFLVQFRIFLPPSEQTAYSPFLSLQVQSTGTQRDYLIERRMITRLLSDANCTSTCENEPPVQLWAPSASSMAFESTPGSSCSLMVHRREKRKYFDKDVLNSTTCRLRTSVLWTVFQPLSGI